MNWRTVENRYRGKRPLDLEPDLTNVKRRPLTTMTLPSIRFQQLTPWLSAVVFASILPSCIPVDDFGRPIPREKPKREREAREEQRSAEMMANEQAEARRKAEMEARELEWQRKTQGNVKPKPDQGTELPKPDVDQFKPKPDEEKPKPKPKEEARKYPVAVAVPEKPGFVYSPYNNRVLDVKEVPSGTLVGDPQYPPTEKKHFYVP
jgi:hypothetical protein